MHQLFHRWEEDLLPLLLFLQLLLLLPQLSPLFLQLLLLLMILRKIAKASVLQRLREPLLRIVEPHAAVLSLLEVPLLLLQQLLLASPQTLQLIFDLLSLDLDRMRHL